MSDRRPVLRELEIEPLALSAEDRAQLRSKHARGWCKCVELVEEVTPKHLLSYLRDYTEAKLLEHTPPDASGIEHWVMDIGDTLFRPGTKDRVMFCVSSFKNFPRATADNIMFNIERLAAFERVTPAEMVRRMLPERAEAEEKG